MLLFVFVWHVGARSIETVAKGCEAFLDVGEDPNSHPIDSRPTPSAAPAKSPPKYAAHGRVLAPDGQPVPAVWVVKDGVQVGESKGWGNWNKDGWPERVLTDTNGEFTFARDKAFNRIHVRIRAPGLAPLLGWLDATNTIQTLHLAVGVLVRGRVLRDGQPLGGVRVGLTDEEQKIETDPGHEEARTKEDGTFEFLHLCSDRGWVLHGVIPSFNGRDALGTTPFKTAADGTTNDLGDLTTKPALRLAGVLKTRRGEPPPKGATMTLVYDDTSESLTTQPNKDGQFSFEGLYSGDVSLNFDADHWRLSAGNRSDSFYDASALMGQLEAVKDDLVVEIEGGENSDEGGSFFTMSHIPPEDDPDTHPLQGVEPSAPAPIVLDGQVIDDDTGKLVPKFKLTPGYQPPRAPTPPKPVLQQMLKPFATKVVQWNERPIWENRRAETVSNGVLSLEYRALTCQPIFRIEAEGYQPYESEPITNAAKNLLIRLKPGLGPNGVVLLPNGEPAGHTTVIYAASGEQFGFDKKSLILYNGGTSAPSCRRETDQQGAFSFPLRPEGRVLLVAHPAGWAEEDVSRSGQNLKLRLKPWATVTGTLVYSNGAPASGMVLQVLLANFSRDGLAPYLNFKQTATTDAQGRFEFRELPPRELQISRRVPRGPGFSLARQTWLAAQPGVTNDLGIVILDTPPPPPVSQVIKEKLGLGP